MKSALLLIDIQNDFISGGALEVPDGDFVIGVANKLMRKKPDLFNYVIATQDWHPANHKSFSSQHSGSSPGDIVDLGDVKQTLWPDHCIQGQYGSNFAEALLIENVDKVFKKGTCIDRDSYSGFFDNIASFEPQDSVALARSGDTGLDDWLRLNQVKELTLMGLATDYCVLFSALDALRLGYAVTVVTDGCKSVDIMPGDGERALLTMQNAGAKLAHSSELLS